MYDRQPGYRWAGTHRLITGSVARRNNAKEFNLGRLIARDTGKVTWPRLRDQKWVISYILLTYDSSLTFNRYQRIVDQGKILEDFEIIYHSYQ